MTTATASATAEVVARVMPPERYARLDRPHFSYAIPVRPGFRLDVRHAEGRWTIVDRETGVFGTGDDPSAAIRDFQRAVAEHLDVLQRQESLSDELAAQLNYLRTRVSRTS
jgi:hypothetical protein